MKIISMLTILIVNGKIIIVSKSNRICSYSIRRNSKNFSMAIIMTRISMKKC